MKETIVINAGHCPGIDPGATGNGMEEADVVKVIGEKVVDILNTKGYNTLFIQNDSLGQICNFANNNNADVFVSIHCNSFQNPSANGTETWANASSINGKRLAAKIQNRMIEEFQLTDRGVKLTDGFYVLNHTDMPAALAETAFISNAEDAKELQNTDGWAKAIAAGIEDYILG